MKHVAAALAQRGERIEPLALDEMAAKLCDDLVPQRRREVGQPLGNHRIERPLAKIQPDGSFNQLVVRGA